MGIDILLNKPIVSAEFCSHIPNIRHERENPEDINALLNTVMDAEFEAINEPKEPIQMLEMVVAETNDCSFSLGVVGSAFYVELNEEVNYYRCDKAGDFVDKLLEIQGR